MGSVSSMEVNVDLLDQMDLSDVSDQDAFDVFFSSGEDGALNSPLPGLDAKSRVSSTSSESSINSQGPVNGNGGDTPSYVLLGVTSSELLSRQKRAWIIDSFTLEEGSQGPFPYVLGKIKVDRKYPVSFEIFGQGVEVYPQGVLTIDKWSGVISVHKSVDYEDMKSLKLKLIASKADQTLDTKLGIEITVLDINDNAPSFQKNLYEVTVGEHLAQGENLLAVLAFDRDKPASLNSSFHYEIGSVSPNPPNAEFAVGKLGQLSFRGCLDYEVGDTYTVLMVARDHGEVVSLSSTATALIHIQDGNNHLPVISGQTGPLTVREGEVGLVPLRLHVTDRDSRHTPAWRARYTVEGDGGGNFRIETDPDTNDGVLTVIKPMDFEEGAERDLVLSVENEMPYYSCEVKARPPTGPWTVDSSTGQSGPGGGGTKGDSVRVTIQVEDMNDPPMFTVRVKEASLEENADIGTFVETLTAVDPDSSHAREFVYEIGSDPGGWLQVDPETGVITTAKRPDRESHYVVGDIYTAVLHAVDSGKPPMTGTATLLLRVLDQNDNMPKLSANKSFVCMGDGPTMTNVTALDPDNEPFGGPFIFELLGEVKGKWSVKPSYGHQVNLVKEPTVYSGLHMLELKISDRQGVSAVNNLTVTVCQCAATPHCSGRSASGATVGFGAIGIMFFALLALLIAVLLAVFMTCKKDSFSLMNDLTYEDGLLSSNIEEPGTDCKSNQSLAYQSNQSSAYQDNQSSAYQGNQSLAYQGNQSSAYQGNQSSAYQYHARAAILGFMSEAALIELLDQRLACVQATEEDLGDYNPHLYAEEGDDGDILELENIKIAEAIFDHRQLDCLGPSFSELAAVCKPQEAQL
ncbi:hypothetical protein NHX12_029800 [Muraenolepis orangiensis]|uniref:Cadherin domain-containing protein n=1 Tax=Muraenolepis orangiensis TaxID=630683 RepID=A0A9Q0E7F7_9TELE|nr:hypothetical protein NHX12_029800 [Muraenolepis orangiensis]